MSDSDWPPFTTPSNPGLDKLQDGTVGIVIPMKNRLRVFKLALFSVLGLTDHPFALVVVDNQSDLSVKKALRDLSVKRGFEVLRFDQEFNFAAEANLGLRHLFQNRKIRYGLVLNSDAVVEPLWLSRMVNVFRAVDRLGVMGPLSDTAIPEQQGPRRNVFEAGPRMVSGFCMMVDRDAFEAVGGFDERFRLGGYEDWDFCERVKAAGWGLGVHHGVNIKHFWKVSRRGDKFDEAMADNRRLFYELHPDLGHLQDRGL